MEQPEELLTTGLQQHFEMEQEREALRTHAAAAAAAAHLTKEWQQLATRQKRDVLLVMERQRLKTAHGHLAKSGPVAQGLPEIQLKCYAQFAAEQQHLVTAHERTQLLEMGQQQEQEGQEEQSKSQARLAAESQRLQKAQCN